jgi:hypothetical protein
MQTIKQQIGDKLAELEALLEQAECDGQKLTDICDDVTDEINGAFNTLCEAVHYYLD